MSEDSLRGPHPAVCGWHDGWYVVPHEVTWRDLDAIGHVNNTTFFTYFEWARTKYWFALHGIENHADLSGHDLGFIVAHAQCDFRQQLGLCEKIDIVVRIGDMRTTSLDFLYEIRRRESGEIVATGKVVVVQFSWKTNDKIEISEAFRDQVRRFQSGG